MSPIADDWHPWQIPEKHLKIEKHKNILCHECHVAGRKRGRSTTSVDSH